jgi:hypothetical protein
MSPPRPGTHAERGAEGTRDDDHRGRGVRQSAPSHERTRMRTPDHRPQTLRPTPAVSPAMPPSTALTLLALLALPIATNAQPLRVLTRAPGAATASMRPVQARVGEPVTLSVALATSRGITPIPTGARVRWLRVLPRMEHVDHPSPNPGLTSFSNAVLYGPRHGRWIGYDRLEYVTRPVDAREGEARDDGTLTVRAAALEPARGGAGSMWFSAEVTLPDGRTLRAPDGADVDTLGLSPDVARVSFRVDDSYLGWLGTYFGVPNVFGSNGTARDHQTDRYTGADCADVLVGALRAMGRRDVPYLSVAQIGTAAARRTGTLVIDRDGRYLRDVSPPRWGTDIAPGDLVTLGYLDDDARSLPRDWDHIAALVADANGNGVLDGPDVIRHVTARGLDETPLVHAGRMQIALWRWSRAARARSRYGAR